tara:strand:- start:45 stop:230 length:186 start_codon:yes stop_codon:yes gene_type:complete
MNIQSAQYQADPLDSTKNAGIILILQDDDTKYYVPLDTANRHYNEIMKQVADGTLTIKDAE